MRRNFSFQSFADLRRGTRFWLLIACGVLALANVIALYFYLAPPGGTQAELQQQRDELSRQIAATRRQAVRLHTVAGKVETGSQEANDFEARYFLPERVAYSDVIAEIQRMAKASGLEEREAVYSQEAIEGSDDLSVLNTGARFLGTYPNFMRFLHEADTSPLLLMLDTVQATPQQHGGQIEAQIRFQSIVTESSGVNNSMVSSAGAGGQP